MKNMILGLGFLLSGAAHAADALTIYQCEYRISRPYHDDFVLRGNIVADDAVNTGEPYAVTYLTLAPNQLSGDTTEARVLITSDGYNPITLHAAGGSATPLATGLLKPGVGGEARFARDDGRRYTVSCRPR